MLLSTKLTPPPPRAARVTRPRLAERLAAGLARRLTLIAAPPGYGKTTLVSTWAAQHPSAVAWVSLDEADDDPALFWAYVIAALQRLQANIGAGALALLQGSQPLPPGSVPTMLINDLVSQAVAGVLVLDDLHLIADPAIHADLFYLIEHLPPTLPVVVTTRTEPPWLLARLRARDQVVEIGAGELRFSPDEAASFLKQVMGLDLASSDVASLEARTEGWPAGLQLAALSLQGRASAARAMTEVTATFEGSHDYVMNYLLAEVLQRQPPAVQTFLLQTSVLDPLSPEVCNAVTGRDDAPALLAGLHRANLFITPLDPAQRMYRYHPLLAEMLRERLSRTDPRAAPELHRRASLAYESLGRPDLAVRHALAAGDAGRAAALVEQAAPGMLAHGEVVTLRRWLDGLPPELVARRPSLGLSRAWVMAFSVQLSGLAEQLDLVEQAVASDPTIPPAEREDLLGQVTALRASVAISRGERETAIDLCRQAAGRVPADRLLVHSLVAFGLALAQRMGGDNHSAEAAFGRAAVLGRQAGQIALALYALVAQAELHAGMGQLGQAQRIYQSALDLAAERDAQAWPVLSAVHLGLGNLCYEWNNLPAAGRHLAAGLQMAQQTGNDSILLGLQLGLARLRLAQGDGQAALAAAERAFDLARAMDHPGNQLYAACLLARVQLALGDVAAAARWQQTLPPAALAVGPTGIEAVRLLETRLDIAESSFEGASAAARELPQLLAAAQTQGRVSAAVEILIVQAVADRAAGRLPAALAAIEQALALAEPAGLVRVFVDEGAALAALIARVSPRRPYIARLLAAFPTLPDASPMSQPMPAFYEPLTEREREILRCLAAGQSNTEIASRLVISPETVKVHLKHIYAKLAVNTRRQAVEQGRALKLV